MDVSVSRYIFGPRIAANSELGSVLKARFDRGQMAFAALNRANMLLTAIKWWEVLGGPTPETDAVAAWYMAEATRRAKAHQARYAALGGGRAPLSGADAWSQAERDMGYPSNGDVDAALAWAEAQIPAALAAAAPSSTPVGAPDPDAPATQPPASWTPPASTPPATPPAAVVEQPVYVQPAPAVVKPATPAPAATSSTPAATKAPGVPFDVEAASLTTWAWVVAAVVAAAVAFGVLG